MSLHTTSSQAVSTRGKAAKEAAPVESIEWFKRQVERGQRLGMFSARMVLTPELAKHIIANHMPPGSNRRFRVMKAAAFKDMIKAGRWNPNTHQGIAFAPDGMVNDGQHRITAAAEAGIDIEVPATFGQPRETFEVIDQGITPRTASDLIDLAGLECGASQTAAAIARFMCARQRMIEGRAWAYSSREVSSAEVLEFARDNEAQLGAAVRYGRNIANGIKAKVSPSNVGMAFYLIRASGADETLVGLFAEGLQKGSNLAADSPILHCREGLRKGEFGSHVRSHSDRRAYEAGAVVLAWNRWTSKSAKLRRTTSTSALKITDPKSFPEVA